MQNESVPVHYQPVNRPESQSQSGPVRVWAPRIVAGALAGLAASIPMGLMMIALNRTLTRRAEPPKLITQRIANRFGFGKAVPRGKSWDPLTWASHASFGAAAASLYPVVTRPLPIPGILRGMLFALGVWAASYMGWLPAAHILPPANQQPARRNVVMIVSHLLWGSLIGLLDPRIEIAERRIMSRRQARASL